MMTRKRIQTNLIAVLLSTIVVLFTAGIGIVDVCCQSVRTIWSDAGEIESCSGCDDHCSDAEQQTCRLESLRLTEYLSAVHYTAPSPIARLWHGVSQLFAFQLPFSPIEYTCLRLVSARSYTSSPPHRALHDSGERQSILGILII